MKTKILVFVIAFAFSLSGKLLSQTNHIDVTGTTTGVSGDIYHMGGNVGIGTTSPDYKLDIESTGILTRLKATSSAETYTRWEQNDGDYLNIGVSTDANAYSFINSEQNPLKIISETSQQFYIGSTSTRMMTLTSAGLGIGTTTIPSEYKLAVAGKIIATEVKVALETNWPDYVFTNNYQLKTLTQVENYITQNNHLPDVPSAAEV